MFSLSRDRAQSILWLCVPTLLWSVFLQSATLCIDPLLFPVIEQKLPPRIIVLWRWSWVAVFSITLLRVWNIGPGTYLFYLREALPFTPRFILVALGLSALTLIWFAARRQPAKGFEFARSWLFAVGAVLLFVKILAASETLHSSFLRNSLRSPVLANMRIAYGAMNGTAKRAVSETPESTFNALTRQEKILPSRVVLMIVESWGETPDGISQIASEISKQGFHVNKYGFASYRGSTLSGEFRELCSKYIQPSDGLVDKISELECAPKFLGNKGYEVIGIHGYKKSFYARTMFWDRFGVKKQVFGEDLEALPLCPGPFTGVCDENLIRRGVGMMDAVDSPVFLYMLTLSSHEPVDTSALGAHGKHFAEIKVVHPTQVITRRAISELVDRLAERRRRECTLVYVAGDHQPPSASAKGGIFETGKVPYLVFTDGCLEKQQ
jgi:hypothetical protein